MEIAKVFLKVEKVYQKPTKAVSGVITFKQTKLLLLFNLEMTFQFKLLNRCSFHTNVFFQGSELYFLVVD